MLYACRICPLQDSMDPDEFIRKQGKASFHDLLEHGLKPFPFILEFSQKGKDFSQAEDVIAYLDEITPYMLKISDPVKQSLIIK